LSHHKRPINAATGCGKKGKIIVELASMRRKKETLTRYGGPLSLGVNKAEQKRENPQEPTSRDHGK